MDLFTAYRKGKGLAELHVFQMGAHGFPNKGGGADHYLDRLEEWLGANKLLSKPSDAGAAANGAGSTQFHELHGGAFGVAGVAWLKRHLNGDQDAAKMFTGDNYGLKADPKWRVEMKNMW